MGGTGAVHKTDWHCLEGRHVTLWPDADDNETGLKAMTKLAGIAEARAASVRMIKPEPERNKEDEVTGWDVADAIKISTRGASTSGSKAAPGSVLAFSIRLSSGSDSGSPSSM